ncbi:MAG: 3-keto-5-aminohexanoate cleavage protein [Balneolaceae bacterium]|nr:3-keto-5-aminohexanoate cleavage protein [Balneolaceae bacterium]
MKKKIIINFCPTGMVPTKGMTPHVPITPQEIIEQTHEAFEQGITIAHLHARENDGVPDYKATAYAKIFDGIRKHCPGLVICGSTSGRLFQEFEKRSEVIELKPDMCSLTLSSLNFMQHASMNQPSVIRKLAEKMSHYGVKPELECFDLGMINYGLYLINKGVIKEPCYWNLLFGNIAGMQPDFSTMAAAVSQIPNDHHIAFGGLGSHQLTVNATAIAHGYGVRTGLEDSIWMDSEKTVQATNINLIQRIHTLIELHGREYMKPEEFGNLGFYNV